MTASELINEQLTRNASFLTPAGLTAVRSSVVVVIGLGGVGSHCATALARSGVSRLRLVDFDQVSLSSLNRHAVATLADVGTPKVRCLKKHLQQITPWVQFDLRNELFSATSADALLETWQGDDASQDIDYVVDAIDNIDSKVALLAYCYQRGIKVISSMGAGCKSDPTRIFIGDISNSTDDPLSRSTRRRLRLQGIASGIPVIYSTEKPGAGKAQLLPLSDEEFAKGDVGELGVLPDFRVRILPVLGTMPAMFGYAAANHVILNIARYPCEYIPAKGREKLYDAASALLQGMEQRLAQRTTPGHDAQGLKLPITTSDIGYVIEEIFRGKSVASGVATRLAVVRWRKPPPATSSMHLGPGTQKTSTLRLDDLVCLTRDEAVRHEREIILGTASLDDLYTPETVQLVQARLAEGRQLERYR